MLEQRWPQVDMDYHLDLRCLVNNQECCEPIKMPRSKLDELDESSALKLLQESENYLKYYASCAILKTTFEHHHGLSSVIRLLVDETNKTKFPVS